MHTLFRDASAQPLGRRQSHGNRCRSLVRVLGLWVVCATAFADSTLERGEYLLNAAGCIACHTVEDSGQTLAGGRELDTPFGIFRTPNITADPKTGIGTWSDADFIRAMRYGVGPNAKQYYPAFPYTSYAGMSTEDMLALKAYLFSLPPIEKPNAAHSLVWFARARWPLRAWKALNHDPKPFSPDPTQSDAWNRGAYLVRHLGHCGECHTPRDLTGAMIEDQELAGNPHGPENEPVPRLTPDGDLGDWSVADIVTYLEMGLLPDGDFVGGAMTEVIDENTAKLTVEDRRAITTYLRALPRPSD